MDVAEMDPAPADIPDGKLTGGSQDPRLKTRPHVAQQKGGLPEAGGPFLRE